MTCPPGVSTRVVTVTGMMVPSGVWGGAPAGCGAEPREEKNSNFPLNFATKVSEVGHFGKAKRSKSTGPARQQTPLTRGRARSSFCLSLTSCSAHAAAASAAFVQPPAALHACYLLARRTCRAARMTFHHAFCASVKRSFLCAACAAHQRSLPPRSGGLR